MNVNKVMLVGRLTRDPEIRNTASGQTVATIGLATSERWNDKNGQKQERTEFHRIIVWGRLAEIAGQYLTKGQEAFFEGRLQTNTFTGKDGVERKAVEIVAENMQLGSRPQGAGVSGSTYQSRQAAPSVDSRSQTPPQTASTKVSSAEEDIPTINLDDERDEIRIEDVPF
jgi:single-strand DNA-binding protein